MSSHQLDIPSITALVVVAGLVVTTVWAVPYQVVAQDNIETKSHVNGELVEPGHSIEDEVEDIDRADHYRLDFEEQGEVTVDFTKLEGNETKFIAGIYRMDGDHLLNYTTLERDGQLSAEITDPGMHYIKIEGDGYTNYSFTVNFDQAETETPTETTETPTETTETPTETTETPTETTTETTTETETPTETTDTN